MLRTAEQTKETKPVLERQLVIDLEARHGPLLSGTALQKMLGFPSAAAFRQAASRGQLPVAVFTIPNRRGRFALTREVAGWLATLQAGANL